MDAPPTSTMRRDVISAYVLTTARVLTWLVVSAIVYRRFPYDYFDALSLIRWTIGLLAYTSIGLGPAMVHALAQARRPAADKPLAGETIDSRVLTTKGSGIALSLIATALTLLLTLAYRASFPWLHRVPSGPMTGQFAGLILFFGIGDALRVLSEPQGSILQTEGHIALDNTILFFGELAWAVLSVSSLPAAGSAIPSVVPVAASFAMSSLGVLILRMLCTIDWHRHQPVWRAARLDMMLRLLGFGSLVLVSQLSDFLYAPTDMILINRLLSTNDLAAYAPAIQIDAGLLLLMTGLAAVLLPKAALAHAAGDKAAVRRYYVRGTILGGAGLAIMAFLAWLISPGLLRLWLRHPLPETRMILPLVLMNTVIGGSSAVGRAILLGMGRVRAFTVAVVVAGVTNVICSYVFVRYFHLGLKGIVLGTLVAVIARCGLWMPWYVLWTLRKGDDLALDTPTPRVLDVLPID